MCLLGVPTVRQQKKIKPISEMVNSRQSQAITNSLEGDCTLLIQVCQECYKAELKALKAVELGVPEWGTRTAEHYNKLRSFLETHFYDDSMFKTYRKSLERMESDGK